jgi:hypothetical protein
MQDRSFRIGIIPPQSTQDDLSLWQDLIDDSS